MINPDLLGYAKMAGYFILFLIFLLGLYGLYKRIDVGFDKLFALFGFKEDK